MESGNISANAFCRFSVSGFTIASSVPTNYDEYKISVVAGAGSSGAVPGGRYDLSWIEGRLGSTPKDRKSDFSHLVVCVDYWCGDLSDAVSSAVGVEP